MYTLGPYNLTAGTPVGPLTIGRDVGAIQVHNDSPYNIYLSASAAKPSAVDSLSGNYLEVATPNAHPVLRLQPRAGSPAEQAPNAISNFAGTLYLMPIDPQAALARNGTYSNLAQVHLTVYSPWEQAPEAWAMPRQMDLTSQPRVISLVPDPWLNFRNQWAPGAAGNLSLVADVLYTGAASGVQFWRFYGLSFSAYSSPASGVAFQIILRNESTDGTVLGTATLVYDGTLSIPGVLIDRMTVPLGFRLNQNATPGSQRVKCYLETLAIAGAPPNIAANIQIDVDVAPGQTIQQISTPGGGAAGAGVVQGTTVF